MKTTLLIILSLFIGSQALCPGGENPCFGHGTCGSNDKCSCHRNWQGIDCSERKCPYGKAWADVIDGVERDGHDYLECSGKGICDRNSGQCQCFPAFEGKGCTRMSCPNKCSGHGTCEYYDEINSSYNGWDGHKIQMCSCDPGYEGYDCSLRKCRTGDDPLTQNQVNQQITLTGASFSSGDSFALRVTDWRGETWHTWALPHDASVTAVKEALEALPNQALSSVTVTSSSTSVWVITLSNSNPGNTVTIAADVTSCTVDGCQPKFSNSGGTITITTTTTATTEGAVCSNRGKCDGKTGLCLCEKGYTGESCNQQTAVL